MQVLKKPLKQGVGDRKALRALCKLYRNMKKSKSFYFILSFCCTAQKYWFLLTFEQRGELGVIDDYRGLMQD